MGNNFYYYAKLAKNFQKKSEYICDDLINCRSNTEKGERQIYVPKERQIHRRSRNSLNNLKKEWIEKRDEGQFGESPDILNETKLQRIAKREEKCITKCRASPRQNSAIRSSSLSPSPPPPPPPPPDPREAALPSNCHEPLNKKVFSDPDFSSYLNVFFFLNFFLNFDLSFWSCFVR